MTEKEIVTGDGFLTQFVPIIRQICSSPHLFPCKQLQNAAILALCKFMCVSSEFCEANLQLLFTLLEKSDYGKTRCNIMILIHDLVIRFPNLLVNWNHKIYSRLRDTNVRVRCTTIRVLTTLILNDMIKVKGQISALAICLVDEDTQIRSLTELFFNELSKKTNAIYNVMPDIISHLSDSDTGLPLDSFQQIMKHLFEYIDKDKQAESLVEKLCHRFRGARTEEQWCSLSYCLTLLPYNDKALKKLVDNIQCYYDKLFNIDVYQNFRTIIEKSQKTIKAENPEFLNDFEVKIEYCHTRGGDEALTDAILSEMKDLNLKPPSAKQPKPRKTRRRVSSDEDDVKAPRRTLRNKKSTASRKRNIVASSSDESSDLELVVTSNTDESEEEFEKREKTSGRRKGNMKK